jgi:hypothetical protein
MRIILSCALIQVSYALSLFSIRNLFAWKANLASNNHAMKIHHATKDRIFNRFLGFYDNIDQAIIDLRDGCPTAALGGHEHVTAKFSSYPNQTASGAEILATFTFAYDTSKVFRYRLYQFYAAAATMSSARIGPESLCMRIYRPIPAIEAKLKTVHYNISQYYPPAIDSDFELMTSCDVVWEPDGWLSRLIARYQLRLPSSICRLITYHGRLINGAVEIPSAMNPNVLLTVKDDLRLSDSQLWINDQVFLKNGTRIIGNSRGIHYKFKKILGRYDW